MQMKSAVDPGIAFILWTSVLVCTVSAVALVIEGGLVSWLIAISLFVAGALLPLSFLLRTGYRLETDFLLAFSGPFRWRVRYIDIQSVARKRTGLAGPALSLDRLVIRYGPTPFLLVISPREPEPFQAALIERVEAARKTPPPG